MAQSQWTLAVYKNIEESNYKGHEVKDFKGKGINS